MDIPEAEDGPRLRDTERKFLLDPYLDWAEAEGVPIHEDFAVDMLTMDTAPWERFGVDGALVHLKGRGDFVAVQLIEIAPGAKSAPLRHPYDEVFYVLSGHGSTRIGVPGGQRHGRGRVAGSACAPPPQARQAACSNVHRVDDHRGIATTRGDGRVACQAAAGYLRFRVLCQESSPAWLR